MPIDPVNSPPQPPQLRRADPNIRAENEPVPTFAVPVAQPVVKEQAPPPVEAVVEKPVLEPRLPPPRLRIEFDTDAGRYVYQSVQTGTGEVVQQFPTEEALRRLSYLRDVAASKVDKQA